MIAFSLQSGSNGNSIYIETDTVRLLVDAGLSGVQAERRMAAHGRDIRDVDAVLISHDHADHIGSIGIFQRKFGLPVYVTAPTLSAAQKRRQLGTMTLLHHFDAGETLRFGGVAVETVPTPHDGVDGVAFVVDAGGRRLGVLTDLGHPFSRLSEVVGTLDAVFIESNYDPGMLASGPYPPFLQQRIAGPGGHLSNEEAATLIYQHRHRLEWACLSHLSENNNSPEKALETHRRMLGRDVALHVAHRREVGCLLTI